MLSAPVSRPKFRPCRIGSSIQRTERAQEVSMRKDGHAALHGAQLSKGCIDALAHLLARFTAGTTIAKHVPIRALRMDLRAGQTLVVAVVPLAQSVIHARLTP